MVLRHLGHELFSKILRRGEISDERRKTCHFVENLAALVIRRFLHILGQIPIDHSRCTKVTHTLVTGCNEAKGLSIRMEFCIFVGFDSIEQCLVLRRNRLPCRETSESEIDIMLHIFQRGSKGEVAKR